MNRSHHFMADNIQQNKWDNITTVYGCQLHWPECVVDHLNGKTEVDGQQFRELVIWAKNEVWLNESFMEESCMQLGPLDSGWHEVNSKLCAPPNLVKLMNHDIEISSERI